MKKLLVLVAILAVAAPSMAATTVSCAQVGSTAAFTISYNYDGAGSFPRAFALDVTTSAGTISGVTATKTGESTSGSLGFGIFPGTIVIDTATGTVTNVGSPVAPAADPGAKPGIGTNAVTLELGSLYATGGKPANSGVLVTVALAGVTTSATVSIVPNTTRGSVVLEDATTGTFTGTTCPINLGPVVCKGDVNASNSVTGADVVALVALLNNYGGTKKNIASTNVNFSLAGDADVSGSNTGADVVKIVGWLNNFGGTKKNIACPHTYN